MRKTLAAVITASTAAAMISGVSLASASTRPASPGGSAVEHFQLMSTSSTSSRNSLVAYGAFTGGGTDIVHASGSETYQFANGGFVVVHKIVSVKSTFEPKTCLLKELVHGTYTISQGTGKFAGISGSGKATVSILSVFPRVSGACSRSAEPTAFQEFIEAEGPVQM